MWTRVKCGNTHYFLVVVFICSNNHIEMFMVKEYIIDSSIIWRLNIYTWQNNYRDE